MGYLTILANTITDYLKNLFKWFVIAIIVYYFTGASIKRRQGAAKSNKLLGKHPAFPSKE